jgi:hypothetical protein
MFSILLCDVTLESPNLGHPILLVEEKDFYRVPLVGAIGLVQETRHIESVLMNFYQFLLYAGCFD